MALTMINKKKLYHNVFRCFNRNAMSLVYFLSLPYYLIPTSESLLIQLICHTAHEWVQLIGQYQMRGGLLLANTICVIHQGKYIKCFICYRKIIEQYITRENRNIDFSSGSLYRQKGIKYHYVILRAEYCPYQS